MSNSTAGYDETPRIFTSGTKKKVLFVPAAIFPSSAKDGSDFQISLETLPHPRTGDSCLWAFSTVSGKVYQLVQSDEKFRSWFIGNYVLEDGAVKCLVPLDPLFVVLPYFLNGKKRRLFQPLSQILVDTNESKVEEFSTALHTLINSADVYLKDLDLICSIKGFKDEKFFKLSRGKLATWLKVKVRLLSESLEKEKVNVSSKVTVAGYSRKEETQTKDQYDRYAFGMLCDYLPPSLQEEMMVLLDMGEPQIIQGTAPVSNNNKKQKSEVVEAAEDYTKSFKLTAAAPEKKLTAAQKRLMKVDRTGMKSISSYFTHGGATDKCKK